MTSYRGELLTLPTTTPSLNTVNYQSDGGVELCLGEVIDSIQLTAKYRVATPVNWKQGEDVIIAGSVSDEEAKKLYPKGWRAPKPYVRIVPPPG